MRRIGAVVAVGLVAIVLLSVLLVFQATQQNELIRLTGNYVTDGVTVDESRINTSWSDGFTLSIAKNGVIHTCKHVRADDLHQGKPITCEDGAVINAK
ncbi:hypothetical protein [Arthrobacter sp. UYCo732]|uniref:hypothetical protein n=1 Tax=Arthrobacter sp. UYCo732 TaxID=3156336 RepID=UPI0033956454